MVNPSMITGDSGPYKTSSPLGKSANAGYNTAKMLKEDPQKLTQSSLQYLYGPDNLGGSAIAFSTEELKAYNPSGRVTKDEFVSSTKNQGAPEIAIKTSEHLFDVMDTDKKGVVDPAKNAAYMIFADNTQGKADGKIDPDEIALANTFALTMPEYVQDKLKQISTHFKLEERVSSIKEELAQLMSK